MALVRVLAILLLLLLTAGLVYVRWTAPSDVDELPAVNPYPFMKTGEWAWINVKDLRLAIPKEYSEFTDNGKQWLFYGPEYNGFRSSVQVLQRKWHKDAQAWYDQERGFHDNPIRRERIIDEGDAQIAGRPARVILWETKHKSASGERAFVTIEWCFVRGGKAYWLRGLADRRTFVAGHRLLFEQVARTVRFQ